MTGTVSIKMDGSPASPEENTDALKAAAEAAPANEAEARQQLSNEEANKSTGDRPDWLPEKFKSPEDMAKAYSDLETKLGSKGEESSDDTPENGEGDDADKAKGEDTGKEKDAESDKDKAGEVPPGEVFTKLTDIFTEKGEFTDEDYALAETGGFSREQVESYVAGQQALAEAATQRITDAAGGKDGMERLFAWAKTGLPADQIAEYNKSFEGSDVNAAVIAMEGLKTKYEAANGKTHVPIGGKNATTNPDVFGSWAEVTRAMNDPRYKTDPAYNSSVQQKLGRSNI